MMNNSLKSLCNLPPGTLIAGKWNGCLYQVVRQLGHGANGVVYLVDGGGVRAALKMSDNAASITSEANVLKSFSKVQGSVLGPCLLDVDDWEHRGKKTSFYVMEYIKGPSLLAYMEQKGPDWLGVLMLQLLDDLANIHRMGWVFGDLKPENLIVTGPPARIRCIDVGGTTMKGRAIKEFTEFFDRGYWGLGSRKAEESYDLFAVAMVMLNIAYPNRFQRKEGGVVQLMSCVNESGLKRYGAVLERALTGKYQTADEMRLALLGILHPEKKRSRSVPSQAQSRQQARGAVKSRSRRKKGGIGETALIVTAFSLLYFLYVYVQIL